MDKIVIGEKEFDTLIAITPKQQESGLMFVKWPPPVMAFPYSYAGIRHFWMKNTPSPLDIIFCNKGKILEICEGRPYSTELIGPNSAVDLVVEMPYGTCATHGFKKGTSVSFSLSVKSAVDLSRVGIRVNFGWQKP